MTFEQYINNLRQNGRRYFTVKEAYDVLNLSRNAALSAIALLKVHKAFIIPAKGLYVRVPHEHQLQGSITMQNCKKIFTIPA